MCELYLGSKVSIIFWAHFLGIWISVNDKKDGKLKKKKSECEAFRWNGLYSYFWLQSSSKEFLSMGVAELTFKMKVFSFLWLWSCWIDTKQKHAQRQVTKWPQFLHVNRESSIRNHSAGFLTTHIIIVITSNRILHKKCLVN